MALRDKKGILFILREVVQSYLSVLCVHSRLTDVLLRFNLDNKFQRGGGTESYVHEQTLENQSRQLPESALSSRSPHYGFSSRPELNAGLHNDLQDLKPCSAPLNTPSGTLSVTQATLTFLKLLEKDKHALASTPLHFLTPLPGTSSPQSSTSFNCLPPAPCRRGLSGSSYVEQKPTLP